MNGGWTLRRTSGFLAALLVLPLLVSCELRERRQAENGGELAPVRVVSPDDLGERLDERPDERMGPVFAPVDEGPLIVGDEYWAGPGTVGYELVATFISREAMLTLLDPRGPVGRDASRLWELSDILVGVDYRGPGNVAKWRVVGPTEVVEPYVSSLEEGLPRGAPISQLGVLALEVRHCCLDLDPPGTP